MTLAPCTDYVIGSNESTFPWSLSCPYISYKTFTKFSISFILSAGIISCTLLLSTRLHILNTEVPACFQLAIPAIICPCLMVLDIQSWPLPLSWYLSWLTSLLPITYFLNTSLWSPADLPTIRFLESGFASHAISYWNRLSAVSGHHSQTIHVLCNKLQTYRDVLVSYIVYCLYCCKAAVRDYLPNILLLALAKLFWLCSWGLDPESPLG